MLRVGFFLATLCIFVSCASHHPIVGTWETTHLILGRDERFTVEISKGEFRYYTMKFNSDGSLVLAGRRENDPSPVAYAIQNDTLTITANNGVVSVVPIVKLTNKELQTLNLVDSTISIYRRIR